MLGEERGMKKSQRVDNTKKEVGLYASHPHTIHSFFTRESALLFASPRPEWPRLTPVTFQFS